MDPVTTGALIGAGTNIISGILGAQQAEKLRKEQRKENEKDRQLQKKLSRYQSMTNRPQQLSNVMTQMIPLEQQNQKQDFMNRVMRY